MNITNKLAAAAASTGVLGLIGAFGYPSIKSIKKNSGPAVVHSQWLELPTATADLTNLPEEVGVSHWFLISLLNSNKQSRRDCALKELSKDRKWNDAECLEIAQALERKDIIKIARTGDADIRLFLPPPSMAFIEKTLESVKVDKLVKEILRNVSENTDNCSSCTSFYTNLSIRLRPDPDVFTMSELNNVDKMMRIESKKRKRSAYNEDVIRLKAVLNNVICGQKQALAMLDSGMMIVLLYFRHKYEKDVQINALLAQILANLSADDALKENLFINGWIQTLTNYGRSDNPELSMPAHKALANLDEEAIKTNGTYGNHIYLLSPVYRDQNEPEFDVIFVHGLVGSVFKSWRQGSIEVDEYGESVKPVGSQPPTTELLPNSAQNEISPEESVKKEEQQHSTKCWPRDWLPVDIPGLRVLAVDYPTALSNWRTDCDLNKDTLRQRANHVMNQLKDANLGSRPIVWVAHSMGGLLVKQILVICDEQVRQQQKEQQQETVKKNNNGTSNSKFTNDNYNKKNHNRFASSLLEQTKGIVFYSVPHKGSNLGWIERKNLQKLLMLTTEVIELQKGSPLLAELHDKFVNLSNDKIQYLTFAENAISSFGVNKVVKWKGVLVHEESLKFEKGPTYSLNIDHAHTCKPHSKQAITYVKTLEFIKSLMPTSKKDQDLDENILPYISFVI